MRRVESRLLPPATLEVTVVGDRFAQSDTTLSPAVPGQAELDWAAIAEECRWRTSRVAVNPFEHAVNIFLSGCSCTMGSSPAECSSCTDAFVSHVASLVEAELLARTGT